MKEKHYTALIDADTIVYSSAATIQKNPIEVEHKASGRTKMFDNLTAFRGWLSSSDKWAEEDFVCTPKPHLLEPVSHAIQIIKNKFEAIESLPWCKDIKIFVGGQGNFRKDIYPDYKGKRGDKPLAFSDCYNYVLNKWKDRVEVCHGYEAEDHAAAEAYASYLTCREQKDKHAGRVVLVACDKDVDMISGWRFNYLKPDLGVYWIDSLTAYKSFAKQMLIGDRSTDNIRGVETVTPEMKETFGIKTKSIGEASAKRILQGLESEKDILERLVKVYQMAYEDDWKNQMDLTGKLVWITREKFKPFDLESELSRVGVVPTEMEII